MQHGLLSKDKAEKYLKSVGKSTTTGGANGAAKRGRAPSNGDTPKKEVKAAPKRKSADGGEGKAAKRPASAGAKKPLAKRARFSRDVAFNDSDGDDDGDESNEEDEKMPVSVRAKAAAAAKPAAKAAAAKASPAKKTPAKAAPKKKVVESDSEDDVPLAVRKG